MDHERFMELCGGREAAADAMLIGAVALDTVETYGTEAELPAELRLATVVGEITADPTRGAAAVVHLAANFVTLLTLSAELSGSTPARILETLALAGMADRG